MPDCVRERVGRFMTRLNTIKRNRTTALDNVVCQPPSGKPRNSYLRLFKSIQCIVNCKLGTNSQPNLDLESRDGLMNSWLIYGWQLLGRPGQVTQTLPNRGTRKHERNRSMYVVPVDQLYRNVPYQLWCCSVCMHHCTAPGPNSYVPISTLLP